MLIKQEGLVSFVETKLDLSEEGNLQHSKLIGLLLDKELEGFSPKMIYELFYILDFYVNHLDIISLSSHYIHDSIIIGLIGGFD